jgi:Ca2+-transporting ATPase
VLADDAYPTVVAEIAAGRNLSEQLRRVLAFYLGAQLALVLSVLIPLAMGQGAPFRPVHILLLEAVLDLGATVAFLAEHPAPAARRRPPRAPGARLLDRSWWTALLSVAFILTVTVVADYLLVLRGHSVGQAQAAALLVWLMALATSAWALRAVPWLPAGQNPAFPLWTAGCATVGLLLVVTGAGGLLDLRPLPSAALAGLGWVVLAGIVLLVIGRTVLNVGLDLKLHSGADCHRAAALTHAASDGTTHRGKVSRQRGCPHRHPGSSRARPPVSGRARGGRGRCVERPPAD